VAQIKGIEERMQIVLLLTMVQLTMVSLCNGEKAICVEKK
jgi:hypothetical protein